MEEFNLRQDDFLKQMTAEQRHYESESFWNSKEIPSAEQNRIIETVNTIPKNVNSILDAGCGNGWFLNYLDSQNETRRLCGVDRSFTALGYVKTEKLAASIDSLPFENQEFDLVSSLQCLEHLPCSIFENALEEICRVAKQYVLITVPNDEDIKQSMFECPQCKSRFNVSHHFRTFTEKTLNNLLLNRGFRCNLVTTLSQEDVRYVFENKLLRGIWEMKIRESFFKAKSECIVCNAKLYNEDGLGSGVEDTALNQVYSRFKSQIKLFWPKKKKKRWLIALYEREK